MMVSIAHLKLRLDHKKNDRSYCIACDEEVFSSKILICASCLDDECQKFADLFEDENIVESEYGDQYPGKK